MDNTAESLDCWEAHAKNWDHFASPLRPSLDDISIVEKTLKHLVKTKQKKALSVVLLGVTPELALIDWPLSTNLTVIDRCPHMIKHVFPYSKLHLSNITIACSDWRSMKIADQSADLILGDGCYAFMDFPDQFEAFSSEINRVLSPNGFFVTRIFVRPEAPESPAQIFSDLFAGKIKNFHALKWRLVMALHHNLSEGVVLGSVWKLWEEQEFDLHLLAQRFSWSRESIETIYNYRASEGRYFFPTLDEIKENLSSHFKIDQIHYSSYQLSERCPTFVLYPLYNAKIGKTNGSHAHFA